MRTALLNRLARIQAAALASLGACAALAQPTDTVVVTGRSATLPSVTGFGGVELARSPLQAGSFGSQQLFDAGVSTLGGLTRLDAGISDGYNAEGYWSQLTVRGFVLDNRSNYRRDGLPVNAETSLLLGNKERVDVLKGIGGIQSGTSSPGGLVDLVVKRPQGRVRAGTLEVQQGGAVAAAVDWSERFGPDRRFGLRVNAGGARLRPQTRSADGDRRFVAAAGDVQLGPDARLEAEFETSRQSQPSVPGFSLLGDSVPDAHGIDPRVNLNNQPWSQPVMLRGDAASLRWRQRLAGDWQFTAHGAVQRLVNDDRIAFPFGCYDAGADVYYADRYCPDGSFDLYDFRSDHEVRRTAAVDFRIDGQLRVGPTAHALNAGVLFTRGSDRIGRSANNFTGSGRIDGTLFTPAAPDLNDEGTHRDERSTEVSLRDRIALGERLSVWAGLRHTRLERDSVRTDGSRATAYTQRFTSPWLAVAWQATDAALVYASSGRGIETEVVPNRARYLNAAQALPALKSEQVEVGIKHAADGADDSSSRDGGSGIGWTVAAFDIRRPQGSDVCDDGIGELQRCTRVVAGSARHRGVEASAQAAWHGFTVQTSALWLHARLGDRTPTNVPRHALRLQVSHPLPLQFALPSSTGHGIELEGALHHEGPRQVVPDNSVAPIGGWSRLDVALHSGSGRAASTGGPPALAWRLGVDNVFDRRAWREAPYQFGHAYLFPLQPRTWRASVRVNF